MKFYYFKLCLLFLFITKQASTQKFDMAELASSQNKFTRDLYSVIAQGKDGNIFFSPFSVLTAMSMVYLGANEETEKQMQLALNLPQSKSDLQDSFSKVLNLLQAKSEGYQMHSANAAYISQLLSVSSNYSNALQEGFHSTLKSVDFGQTEQVRQEINEFVEQQTNSRIKDLIPQGSLTPLARLVLVNAVYFKGLWKHQFNPKTTRDAPFWLNNEQSINVPMMVVEKKFKYADRPNDGFSMLSMDYVGDDMQMVIILPKERDGLKNVEEFLKTQNFDDLDKSLRETTVRVRLPRFKIEDSMEMIPMMKEMGINDLFDGKVADLSGIAGSKDLYVSNIFHKSFIEVNEEGSEAAAATGVIMMTRALIHTNEFNANRPFFFYIRHIPSNIIIFTGRTTNPQVDDFQQNEVKQ